jgi:phosphoribosylformylglycinamidine synthase
MVFAGRVGVSLDTTALGDDIVAALLNEELGAVVQIRQRDMDAFHVLLDASAISKEHVRTIGHVNSTQEDICITHKGEVVFAATRAECQLAWSDTSYHIQLLRDNPACADMEHNLITQTRQENPGLPFHISFDMDLVQHHQALHKRPRVAILREQGTNGHVEMAYAFHAAGFTAIDVHMSDLIAQRTHLSEFVGIAACGGFSFGDVLGAASGWATSILQHEQVRQQFVDFFNHRSDTFALGICNGCQLFSQLRDLIPGAECWPLFVRNSSEQFEGRVCTLRLEDSETSSIFLTDMQGSLLPVAVAHGEGRATFLQPDHMERVQPLVVARYVDAHAQPTDVYPHNPNGSPQGITGLKSSNGRVLAMMPHPERVVLGASNSWYPRDRSQEVWGPWMKLFINARRWAA